MIKIVHVVESLGSGIVEFIYQLIIHIPNTQHTLIYNQREIDINIIKNKYPKNVVFIEWQFAQREIDIRKDIKASVFLMKVLKNQKFDIVHLHSSKAGFLGRIVTKLLKIRTVIYTPNGAPFARKDISFIKKTLFIVLEFLASRLNGIVICSSQSELESYKRKFIPATYINNGISLPILVKKQTNNKLNGEFIISSSGRACFQKNPQLFNNIAQKFNDRIGVKFIWIGEGELDYVLSSENVKITGWIPKEEALELVSNSDLYLSTALWEGLSFAVLEAMSLGKPLLLNECVGNIDLVQNDKNGFIFRNEKEAIDYINFFLQNRGLLTEYGEASKSIFQETFSAEIMARSYLEAYKNICAS